MAHIELERTGQRVRTRVVGRVYASTGSTKPDGGDSLAQRVFGYGDVSRPKQRRRVCLLSAWSAEMLERFAQSEPCHGSGCRHSHHTRERIEKLVSEGDLRWVGQGCNVAAWSETRTLAVRPSGGVTTVQLVPIGA